MRILKFILTIGILSVFFYSCEKKAAEKIDDTQAEFYKERARLAKVGFPEMTFESKEFLFGKVNEGEKIVGEFIFKNTGKSDLIISHAQASCGCTVPEYEKDKPIKPGESGSIKFIFNTEGKPENQNKTITIYCNSKNLQEVVNIKGYVQPRKEL